jgi:PAS domain S-box-containing protein
LKQARIVIVEDNRIVARDLAQQVTSMGHIVVDMLARGEDAETASRQGQADLVLMDIRLEGKMDGISAAELVRERCQVPVVFLTAFADDETLERAIKSEPFGYVMKPFDDLQLKTVIEMALFKHASERRLRRSEQRFATTLASIGDAVIATDAQALVTFMNPAAEALIGYAHGDALGRSLADLFCLQDADTSAAISDPATAALQAGRIVVSQRSTMLLTHDGRKVPVSSSSSPILDERAFAIGAVLIFSDQTERRAAAEGLRHAQAELARAARLTMIGELTASIAHEVNQPLMAAVTNADTCLRWLAGNTPDIQQARLAAERIVHNGNRAAEIIRSVRAMAQNAPPRLEEVDLRVIVDDVLSIARMQAGRNDVTLSASFAPELPPIQADRVQIQQVVLNLVMNGIEAQLVAENDSGGAREVRIDATLDDPATLVVSVSDLGPGFNLALATRLFDPLFTTKPDGMGLGLAICRSIVEAHGGTVAARHRQPRGSIFQFTMPVSPA